MQDIKEMLQGELISHEVINSLFNVLENWLIDRKEVSLDFQNLTFISTYFLEMLEQFVQKAKGLNLKIQIFNVQPQIYKVFQVARSRNILEVCH